MDDLKQMTHNLVICSTNLAQTVGFVCAQYDQVLARQKRSDMEVSALRNENEYLRLSLEDQLQYSYRDDVEVCGIPKADNESCADLIVRIGNAVGVTITPSDISTAHRLRTPRTVGQNDRPVRHPTIIARFVRRDLRTALIKACRSRKPTLHNLGHQSADAFFVIYHLKRYLGISIPEPTPRKGLVSSMD